MAGEKGQDVPRDQGQEAKDQMKKLFDGKAENLNVGDDKVETRKQEKINVSMETEAKQDSDKTRLDIRAILEQGNEIKGNKIAGFPDAFVKTQLDAMKKALQETFAKEKQADPNETGHFFVKYADMTSGEDKNVYLAAVIDAATSPVKFRFFMKEDSNFIPAERLTKDVAKPEELAAMENAKNEKPKKGGKV